MSKKFWLSRLLGKFGKRKKVVVEPVVEEPVVEEDQEVTKKAKVLTEEEKRRVRVLRFLGYTD